MLLYVTINQGVASAVSYSRNGKIYENFSKIEDQAVQTSSRFLAEPELKNGYVLDGEVMAGSFQELMTQARRKSEVDTDNIVFHVFDIIPVDEFNEGLWNKPLKDRIKLMEKLKPVFNSMTNFKMLESIEVDLDTAAGIDQYNRYCNDKVNEGYEGVMIKDMDAPYECTRTLKWMKYKPVYEYDLVATEVVEGTGRNKGRMGAITFKGTDAASGKYIEVSVGSGWTDEDRDYFYKNPDKALDRTGEILADAITQNADGSYSLRFPRMNKWRDDK
jgi:DNA ligase-1